jgi:site-specific DNA-methyltransferase (adenine-specific)
MEKNKIYHGFELMWEQLERVVKKNGAIVMTASQPLTTILISSNMKMFKYEWIWEKTRPSGHVHAKNKPMKKHENILVFSAGVTLHKGQSENRMCYNPQGLINTDPVKRGFRSSDVCMGKRPSHRETISTKTGYPTSIILIPSISSNVHPTQKPVALMEYLIRTYTNKNETVLDFTIGSGTTAVACINTHRNFIGIEKEQKYVDIARQRITQAQPQLF